MKVPKCWTGRAAERTKDLTARQLGLFEACRQVSRQVVFVFWTRRTVAGYVKGRRTELEQAVSVQTDMDPRPEPRQLNGRIAFDED